MTADSRIPSPHYCATQRTNSHTMKYALNNACQEQLLRQGDLDTVAFETRTLRQCGCSRRNPRSRWEDAVLDDALETLLRKKPLKLDNCQALSNWMATHPQTTFDTLIVAKTIPDSGRTPYSKSYTTYRKTSHNLWCVYPAFSSACVMLPQGSPSNNCLQDTSLLLDEISRDARFEPGALIGPFWVIDSQALHISATKRQLKLHRKLTHIEDGIGCILCQNVALNAMLLTIGLAVL